MGVDFSQITRNEEEVSLLSAPTPKARIYRPPDVRLKDRFEPAEKGSALQLFDVTIDKVNYRFFTIIISLLI